ncbi:hypothetical protein HPB52_025343 [Rhipicephalus sanguineus]|uniref:Peptidase M13 C-terminal domain-containing protein n=1 Tax=Rhipicephalus sanguineus TaxID=34632 RepID=A0A9D4PBM8_RHISA|nr:hypothetical protein HPB52_025343 [Rhipicephalus sanguineus]
MSSPNFFRRDVLFNYAGLRRMLGWACVGSKEFRNASFELAKVTSGMRKQRPRWKVCVDVVNDVMPDSVGYLYVQHKFSPEAKIECSLREFFKESFYEHGLPRSLNFGGIGAVIGHEMTHGFDDEGSQYDEDGALKQWWSNKTRAEFMNRAKCFEQEFGNITDKQTKMTLNGKNTVGENIADTGGLRLAFEVSST